MTVTWADKTIAVVSILTFVGLLGALVFAWRQVRSGERARKAQLLADLSRRWVEEPLVESRRAVHTYKNGCDLWRALEYLEKKNHEQYFVLLTVADFYEDLAILVKEDCINLELVKEMFGTATRHYYDLYEVSIKDIRKKYQAPSIYKNFENLAKEVSG